MTPNQRAGKLVGPDRSVEFIDALLEQPGWISGIDTYEPGEVAIFEEAKQSRLRDLHGRLLDQIAERDAVESEAKMILDVARADLKLHSGMEDSAFADFAKPIENRDSAPWLKRFIEDGVEVIRVIDLKTHGARIATPDEIRDGKFYKDHAEYLADRAA
jgi:hypothetical protein